MSVCVCDLNLRCEQMTEPFIQIFICVFRKEDKNNKRYLCATYLY